MKLSNPLNTRRADMANRPEPSIKILGITKVILMLFYFLHPEYKKYSDAKKLEVQTKVYSRVREELLSYTKKHLD